MIQIGSRIDICEQCEGLRPCGEFWIIEPRRRIFICADCLRISARNIDQAASRLPIPLEVKQ